jgi:hypothetical protein
MNSFMQSRSCSNASFGFAPSSDDTACPIAPTGGRYCRRTVTRVPLASGTSVTRPLFCTAFGSLCQASSVGRCICATESNSTPMPAGPRTVQCERCPSSGCTRFTWDMKRGKFS